ncbi:hypothetical protein BDF22DRAFT_691687 [Syncephalis plumigaleata]|nr:hypothetical protein BDF22DRAFT_691687 [Syncephalis plumigaleata]
MKFSLVIATIMAVVGVNEVSANYVEFDHTKMACLVNNYRQSKGLAPLSLHDTLNESAQRHSECQARHNKVAQYFADEDNLLKRCSAHGVHWTNLKESVACSYNSMESVFEYWTNNSEYAHMFTDTATHFGCGMSVNDDGVPYWTADFACNHALPKNIPKC